VISGRLRLNSTFIDAAGHPVIWEHFGMLDKQSYRDSWAWKLDWYNQNGFSHTLGIASTISITPGGAVAKAASA
jgi:hypothetical protein